MESFAAIAKEFYNNFLLRDFFGKMVPGSVLLFAIFSLFEAPAKTIGKINEEKSVLGFILLGGIAWTMVLGLQSVAE